MDLYEVVMKGPPRWFMRGLVMLIVLVIGVQLAEKDAKIDRLMIALNDAQFDLQVEQVKLDVLICESDARHEGIWGDGGKAYGIAQFWQKTFTWLAKKAGRPELQWTNKRHQLWLLDWALRNGYGKYWTCYKKAQSAEGMGQRVKHGNTVALVQRGKR